MNAIDLGRVGSFWQLDGNGYLLTASGCRAARVDRDGIIWLWDKRSKQELPLTPVDIAVCMSQLEESHEPRAEDQS